MTVPSYVIIFAIIVAVIAGVMFNMLSMANVLSNWYYGSDVVIALVSYAKSMGVGDSVQLVVHIPQSLDISEQNGCILVRPAIYVSDICRSVDGRDETVCCIPGTIVRISGRRIGHGTQVLIIRKTIGIRSGEVVSVVNIAASPLR